MPRGWVWHRLSAGARRARPRRWQGLPVPDAVFVGGGVSEALLDALWARLPPGCRVVVQCGDAGNARRCWRRGTGVPGGTLLRIELAEAGAAGRAARLEGGLSGGAVERGAVIVAGFGFRRGAGEASLRDALQRASAGRKVAALATAADKAGAPCTGLRRDWACAVIAVERGGAGGNGDGDALGGVASARAASAAWQRRRRWRARAGERRFWARGSCRGTVWRAVPLRRGTGDDGAFHWRGAGRAQTC